MSETLSIEELAVGLPSALDRLDPTARVAFQSMQDAHDLKRWADCAALGDAWLDARGEMPALVCVWYAQALMAERRLDEALFWAAVATDGLKDADPIAAVSAFSTYGQALCRAGRWADARKELKKMCAVELPPGEGAEKQGHVYLAISDKWATGWGMTEGRLLSPGRGLPENARAWDGVTKEPVAVLHEQGIGDAVLIARWLPWLADYTGCPVTWYGPNLLHRWMSELHPNVRVGSIEAAEQYADIGASIRAMSLPHLAGVQRSSDVPVPIANQSLKEVRLFRRPRPDHVKVGVCWAGSAGGWHDFERSFPYEEFAPVFAPLDGVEFVNLTHESPVPDGAPFTAVRFADVFDSAATIAQCDLIVSVDTAIVHIAGSLHVPTVAIVPTVPDWRYAWPHGGQTVFYPSVTVLRKRHMLDVSRVHQARQMVEKFAAHINKRVA